MKLDKTTLKILKSRLPKGFIRTTQTRLAKKKKPVSAGLISQNVNGTTYTSYVIEELILLANEHQATLATELKDIKRRARGVKVSN